jgi:hypothetical protein
MKTTSIKSQAIEFEHEGEAYKFEFTPEEEDWWTAFPSKIKGVEFDVHYNEDYGDISVYEVSLANQQNNCESVYHRAITPVRVGETGQC